ncbi:hypothetical protein AWB75_04658 [Caballeronia catudaia]|uniref:Uncharacterized protein n=1 Tax=Caballeronia catudaia TaxID=1777136 RepID=A0A158C7R7_9BURK|nr:hypothetical protein AWB75_04658 [Caballeronia catudaia]
MELTRLRRWIYHVMLVRSGRCCTLTRERLNQSCR